MCFSHSYTHFPLFDILCLKSVIFHKNEGKKKKLANLLITLLHLYEKLQEEETNILSVDPWEFCATPNWRHSALQTCFKTTLEPMQVSADYGEHKVKPQQHTNAKNYYPIYHHSSFSVFSSPLLSLFSLYEILQKISVSPKNK